MARQIAKVSIECKLDMEEDAYVEQFKPYLMDVVFEWCRGASFSKLCEMTEVYEGEHELVHKCLLTSEIFWRSKVAKDVILYYRWNNSMYEKVRGTSTANVTCC